MRIDRGINWSNRRLFPCSHRTYVTHPAFRGRLKRLHYVASDFHCGGWVEGSQSFLLFAAASPKLWEGLVCRPQRTLDDAEILNW